MEKSEKRKIKIMRIISRLNIGGPSIHVKILTGGLNKKKFESKLLVGRLSVHEGDMSYILNEMNGNVERVPMLQREINPVKDVKAFIRILKIVYQYRPDIVHTHTAKAGTLGRLAAIIYNALEWKNIITVHTFHGNVLEGYFGKIKSLIFLMIERVLARFTNIIIAISDTQKWELIHKYKITSADKIKRINLGFDLKPFLNAHEIKGKLRLKHNIGNHEIIVGIIGRLVPIKNHKMFLKVAQKIINSKREIKIKFIVIGDGELHDELETFSRSLGLDENIIFHGWEQNIAMIYADLDILALTSLNEGTPVSIIEAMAAGVPVITTAVGGIKDLLGAIEERKAQEKSEFRICERGILCGKGDVNSFADGIVYMIENNFRKGSLKTVKGKEYIVKNYHENSLIFNVENLYNRLTSYEAVQISEIHKKNRSNSLNSANSQLKR